MKEGGREDRGTGREDHRKDLITVKAVILRKQTIRERNKRITVSD